jgi:two-component system, NarL family, response regulator LiaR
MTEKNVRSSESRVRVLIVDDHAIVRKGIRALLSEVDGFEVVGEADNGQAAVLRAAECSPDVILMDLLMPVMDGIEATRQITSRQPQARILVLTSFAADNKVFPAIKAGASGYLLKDSSPDELVRAIRQVHRGEPSLHPTIARKLLQEVAHPAELQPAPEALTGREMEVLRLIAQGLSNQEIADRLVVSEPTVRAHVSRILGKLHLASRTQAALYAVREGLTDADEASAQEE